jgi:O-antigen ligase
LVAVVLLSSLVVSFAAISHKMVPSTGALWETITDFEYTGAPVERASGLFPHTQVLAAYLTAVTVLSATALMHAPRNYLPPWISAVALASSAVALVLTVTITAMLGAMVAIFIIALWHPRWPRYLVLAAIGVLVLTIAFAPVLAARVEDQSRVSVGTLSGQRSPLIPESLAFRYEVWTQQSLPALSGRIWSGSGATLPSDVQWRSTESMYITLLFRGGIVLLIIWVALWWAFIRTAWNRRASCDPTQQIACKALIALLSVLLFMQLLQPYFTYGGIGHIIWTLGALVVVPGAPAVARLTSSS